MAGTRPAAGAAASRPLPAGPVKALDVPTLISRAVAAPLAEDTLAAMKAWMAAHSPSEVHLAVDNVLDSLALRAAATGAASNAASSTGGGVASYALGFLAKVTGGASSAPDARTPDAAARSISAPVSITRTASGSTPIPTLPADYPDVRLSSYALHFSPSDAAGAKSTGRATPEGTPKAGSPLRNTRGSAPATTQSARTLTLAVVSPSAGGSDGSGRKLFGTPTRRGSAGGAGTGTRLEPAPVHTPLSQTLEIRNVSKSKAHVTIRPLQAFVEGNTCFISVEPTSLSLKKNEVATVSVNIQLLKPGAHVDAFVAVEVVGGLRLLVLVRAAAELSVFGLRPQDAELVTSAGYENIPRPLALLRDRIVEGGDGRGMLQEGIFRVAPAADEVSLVRTQLNEGSFAGSSATCTPTTAAHMIKVYLRELPQRMLESVPTEALLAASNEEDCELIVTRYLSPTYQNLLRWLVDLLAEVARHESTNRMGSKALAVCVGPNLFDTDETVNPMEALMTSQKAVNVVQKLVAKRLLELE